MDNQLEQIEAHFAQIASLIGEKSRAIMLWNLLDGRAYTATELAACADISAQAASNHLAKLLAANLLITDKQGRHKYYRFANEKVALVIENIASLLEVDEHLPKKSTNIVKGIKYARTCYDHIAGKLGVGITKAMLTQKILIHQHDKYELTTLGIQWFETIGINCKEIQNKKRKFAYPCLDWSERKYHLGGALGAALLHKCLEEDWIRRVRHSREVILTGKGKVELSNRLQLDI